jgi:hypothetical protein
MKKFNILIGLGITALLIAACALPVGEDYTISRKDEGIYVTGYDLQNYVPIPQAGDKPVRNLTSRLDLTVKTEWLVEQPVGSGTFKPIPDDPDYTFVLGTVYQALIRLQANPGYQFAKDKDFVYTDGTISALVKGNNSSQKRTITITYKATKQPTVVSDRNLTLYIPKPLIELMPVLSFGGGQYTGTVVWKKAGTDIILSGPFQPETAYKAEVTLSPGVGYTLTGLGANSFSHTEAATTLYDAAGGIITITFSPAAYFVNSVVRLGPVEQEGSALALLKEHRDEYYPLVIKLPPGSEETITGFTLVARTTSPTNVIIDGQGGKLKIQKAGDLMTVGDGVTLTLKNIEVKGRDDNNSPLFKVLLGGKLILDKGAVLANNKNHMAYSDNSDAGGIWVNGGFLKLRDGAAIKGMEGQNTGGVYIDRKGRFIMEGGTIGGAKPGDGNTTTDTGIGYNGGGVQVRDGSFEMNGGVIQGNTAQGQPSGGGVSLSPTEFAMEEGFFTMNNGIIKNNTAKTEGYSGGGLLNYTGNVIMNGGTIKNNTASGIFSGGGVFVYGITSSFIMNSAEARIEGNTAQSESSGGGICAIGTKRSTIHSGTITGNVATGKNSGGGVYIRSGEFVMDGAGAIIAGNRAEGDTSGGGVRIDEYRSVFTMSNGIIKENNVKPGNSFGGVYIGTFLANETAPIFTMSGGARVDEDNPVYLTPGTYITLDGNLGVGTAANIMYNNEATPGIGTTKLLKAKSEALITANRTKFLYNNQSNHINEKPFLDNGSYYGVYK